MVIVIRIVLLHKKLESEPVKGVGHSNQFCLDMWNFPPLCTTCWNHVRRIAIHHTIYCVSCIGLCQQTKAMSFRQLFIVWNAVKHLWEPTTKTKGATHNLTQPWTFEYQNASVCTLKFVVLLSLMKLKWQSFECSYFFNILRDDRKLLFVMIQWSSLHKHSNAMKFCTESSQVFFGCILCKENKISYIPSTFICLSCFLQHVNTMTIQGKKAEGSSKFFKESKQKVFSVDPKKISSPLLIVLALFCWWFFQIWTNLVKAVAHNCNTGGEQDDRQGFSSLCQEKESGGNESTQYW